MAYRITCIPGDGTGPELMAAARVAIAATGVDIDWVEAEAGADVMEKYGTPLPPQVLDAALLHEVIGGWDPRDSTSINAPLPDLVGAARRADVSGLRVGVVREFSGEGYAPGVLQRFHEALSVLESLGAEIVEVSCPHFTYALSAYYLIMPSEVSSHLARFDALRYGLRAGEV